MGVGCDDDGGDGDGDGDDGDDDGDDDDGISNIAWALATLELTGWAPDMAPARSFLEAAMHSFADPAIPGPDNMRVRPKTFADPAIPRPCPQHHAPGLGGG